MSQPPSGGLERRARESRGQHQAGATPVPPAGNTSPFSHSPFGGHCFHGRSRFSLLSLESEAIRGKSFNSHYVTQETDEKQRTVTVWGPPCSLPRFHRKQGCRMANRRQNRGQKCSGSREIYRVAGQNTETHIKPNYG